MMNARNYLIGIMVFTGFYLLSSGLSPVSAKGLGLDMELTRTSFSASLQKIKLSDIVHQLEKDQDLWFVFHDDTLFEQEVTVEFNNLSLEAGLKRILSTLNYSLIFDSEGNPAGVAVIGYKGRPSSTAGVSRTGNAPDGSGHQAIGGSHAPLHRLKDLMVDSGSPLYHTGHDGGPGARMHAKGPVHVPASEDEDTSASRGPGNLNPSEGAPSPGDGARLTADDVQNLKPSGDGPSPGDNLTMSAEDFKNFNPAYDGPGPGSDVTSTEPDVKKLK